MPIASDAYHTLSEGLLCITSTAYSYFTAGCVKTDSERQPANGSAPPPSYHHLFVAGANAVNYVQEQVVPLAAGSRISIKPVL